jgi:hypothetical protein
MATKENCYITLTEFEGMNIFPFSKRSLREKCRTGDVPATRIGGRWYIPRSYAEELKSKAA